MRSMLILRKTGETLMSVNPWKSLHLAGEMENTGGDYSRGQAAAIVEHEFAGALQISGPPANSCSTIAAA